MADWGRVTNPIRTARAPRSGEESEAQRTWVFGPTSHSKWGTEWGVHPTPSSTATQPLTTCLLAPHHRQGPGRFQGRGHASPPALGWQETAFLRFSKNVPQRRISQPTTITFSSGCSRKNPFILNSKAGKKPQRLRLGEDEGCYWNIGIEHI